MPFSQNRSHLWWLDYYYITKEQTIAIEFEHFIVAIHGTKFCKITCMGGLLINRKMYFNV